MLQEYLDRLQLNSGKTTDYLDNAKSTNQVKDVEMDKNADSYVDESVMEKVLQKRSLRMRNMQRTWQVCFLLFDLLIFIVGYCTLYYMLELASNYQKSIAVGFIPVVASFLFLSNIISGLHVKMKI